MTSPQDDAACILGSPLRKLRCRGRTGTGTRWPAADDRRSLAPWHTGFAAQRKRHSCGVEKAQSRRDANRVGRLSPTIRPSCEGSQGWADSGGERDASLIAAGRLSPKSRSRSQGCVCAGCMRPDDLSGLCTLDPWPVPLRPCFILLFVAKRPVRSWHGRPTGGTVCRRANLRFHPGEREAFLHLPTAMGPS
jgi:hypothetical protein